MRPVEELCGLLRDKGLKITPQRRLIFESLQDNVDHPTVEDIYCRVREIMPDMSLATVYHTLRDLVEMGEVMELDVGEGRSRYDPCTDQHSHLVYLGCRRLLDVTNEFDGLELSPEEASGYQIVRREIVFYGYCPDCQG